MASVQEPKPGDLIEVYRGRYQHWAVYAGDDNVVHLTSNTDKDLQDRANSTIYASSASALAVVKKEPLQDVVGKNKWRVNNSLEGEHHSRPSTDIMKDATAQVGNKMRYSALTANCEHFATNLRYGEPRSLQAPDAVAAATGLGVLVGGALALGGLILGSGRYKQ